MKKLLIMVAVIIVNLTTITAQTQWWTDQAGAWENSKWGNTSTGPFTNAWTSGNLATFNVITANRAVTVGAAQSTTGLTFLNTTKQYTIGTLAGSTLTLTGATPTISLGTAGVTSEIDAPISAANQVQITGTGSSVLNLGPLASGTSANVFTNGFKIPSGNLVRINGNAVNAFGTSGNAGAIVVDGNNCIFTNAGSMTAGTGNTIYNAIQLNPSSAANFYVVLGGTKPNGATAPFLLNYNGVISGAGNICLGNQTATGSAGSGGSGASMFSNNGNTYTGKTIFNSKTGYFQCGIDNCLPSTNQFVYGDGGASQTYGLFDLNNFNLTVGSIESNAGTGTPVLEGITNTGASVKTITVSGGGTSNNNATFAGVIGANNATVGSTTLTGTNNIALTLSGSAGTLTLTGANTYTGATTVNAGTLFVNNASGIASGSAVSVGASGTIGGSGKAAGTLSLSGTVSPGSTGSTNNGTFTTGAQTWNSGAKYKLNVNTAGNLITGTAGTDWDLVSSTGAINVSAGSYTIDLTASAVGTFSASTNYTWTIISGSSITGFSASNFTIQTTNFNVGSLSGGTFSVVQSGNNINLVFTPLVPTLTATVSVNPTSGTEVGQTTITITATTSAATIVNSTVDYTITGTGVSSSDFVGSPALTGTITITSGNTTGTATIQIADDQIYEGNETAVVAISNPTGSIATASPATASFTIADDATFYWNGGTITANGPANGGTGVWGTTNAWIAPVNTITGTEQTWADGFPAVFAGTAGVVTLDANRSGSSYTFNTTGYTVKTTAAGPLNLSTGNITLGNNVGLTLDANLSAGGRLGINSVNGTGTAALTLTGPTTGNARIDLLTNGTTIGVPTTISGSGTGLTGYVASGVTGTIISGDITNNSSLTTMIGTSTSGSITIDGSIKGSASVQFSAGGSGGAGTITLNNTNNYGGSTIFNSGNSATIKLGVTNALPIGTSLLMANSSGNGGILDLNGHDQTIGSLTSGLGGGSITNSAASGFNTLIVNQAGNTSFGLPINDGATAKIALEKQGVGILKLTVSNNFTAGLTITGGTLQLGGGNILKVTLPVTLNGGTFSTGASAGNSESTGTLTVTDNSFISFGTSNHQLKFANSSAISWTAGKTITVNNWAGTAGATGTNGQLFVGTDTTGLTSTQLAQINFTGYNPGATILSTGEIVPASANLVVDQTGFTAAFGNQAVGTSSAEQTFTVSGSSLDPTVVVTPPTGFEISLTSGTGFQTTGITINTTGGVLTTTTIYVRFTPLSATSYSGSISVVSGTVTQNVIVNGTGTISGFYSVASGKAATDAIWSFSPIGTGQTITSLGGFSKTTDVTIQTGTTVTTSANTEIKSKNLTVANGAVLKGLNTGASATPYFINVYGDLTVDGQLGLAGSTDSIGINFEGATETVSGAGTINLQRIRKAQNDNTTTSVTINTDMNLWTANAAIYNNFTGTSTLNITVGSGATLNFEGNGDLAMDGTDGTAGTERRGVVTVNGTITGVDTIYALSNNTGGNTGITIASGGLVSAKRVLVKINPFVLDVQSGGKLDISTALELLSGSFAPTGTVTLKSTSTSSIAYLDNFSTGHTGTFSGNITAERFYGSAALFGQHMIGSPVSGITLSALGSTAATSAFITPTATCDELHSANGTAYNNVFSFHESNGSACTMSTWKVEAASGAVTPAQGYSVILTHPGTAFSVTGTPNLATSYSTAVQTNSNWSNTTLQGRSYLSGWSLVSNPYPASLNAATLVSDNTSAGFDSGLGILVWNNTTGAYTAPAGGVIAPFQAFMVHRSYPLTGTGVYIINGTARTTSLATFQKDQNATELTLTATNIATGLSDETMVGFNADATSQFDPTFDCYKIPGDLNRQTLYTVSNNQWLMRNVSKSMTETSDVPVGFEPGVNGTYTFTFDGINSFDATSYIILEDKQLNVMHDARSGAYTFSSNATDNWNRFVLHFTPAAVINTTNATCETQGMINVSQQGTANWNYSISDEHNNTVANGTLNNTSQIATPIAKGIYRLMLTDNNNYTVVKNVEVGGAEAVSATTIYTTTNTVAQNEELTLNGSANNGATYNWSFGDGSEASGVNTTHSYTTAGSYTVTLTATSATGCTGTATRSITVTSRNITGIQNITNGGIAIWSHDNEVVVDFTNANHVDANITLFNIIGQELSHDKYTTSTKYTKAINTIDAGYVIVKVKNGEEVTTQKVFITNVK